MQSAIVETLLSNLWVASVLAAGVWVFARRVRRPALIHGLWIIVLLKLVMPPLWALEIPASLPTALNYVVPNRPAGTPRFCLTRFFSFPEVPTPMSTPAEETGPTGAVAPVLVDGETTKTALGATGLARWWSPLESLRDFFTANAVPQYAATLPSARRLSSQSPRTPVLDEQAAAWRLLASRCAFALWLAGALLCLGWAACRLHRFAALLRLSKPAPLWLHREMERLATQIGLDELPQVWLVPGPVSPMLWSAGGIPRLLFPAELVSGLGAAERETLLLHELVHLRRKDHRVRLLELLVTAIYWWHPLIWWARREVHVAEEACCDAWVVSHLPQRRRAYAEAILRTVDFLADYRPALPPAASGIGKHGLLRSRLVAIMQERVPQEMPSWGRWLVWCVALLALPFVPTLVGADPLPSHPWVLTPVDSASLPTTRATQTPVVSKTPLPSLNATVETPAADPCHPATDAPVLTGLAVVPRPWNATESAPAGSTSARSPAVLAMAVSQDERWLAAAEYGGQVRIRSLADGNTVRSLAEDDISGTAVRALCFSPDGAWLALARDDGRLAFWNWQTGPAPARSRLAHQKRITALAFHPSGNLAASCGEDRRLCLWDISGGLVESVHAHDSAVRGVTWSPDGRRLATCGDDGDVHVWSVSPLTRLHSLPGHDAAVRVARYGPSGALLATADEHGGVRLWTATGAPEPRVEPHSDLVWCMAFSADGRWLATGGFDGTVVLRDLHGEFRATQFLAADGLVSGLEIIGNGMCLLTSGYDGSLKQWTIAASATKDGAAAHDVAAVTGLRANSQADAECSQCNQSPCDRGDGANTASSRTH